MINTRKGKKVNESSQTRSTKVVDAALSNKTCFKGVQASEKDLWTSVTSKNLGMFILNHL